MAVTVADPESGPQILHKYVNGVGGGTFSNTYDSHPVHSQVTLGIYNPYTTGPFRYNTIKAHSLVKRKASNEADAQAQYFYSGYRHPSAYNYGFNPYPYTHHRPFIWTP